MGRRSANTDDKNQNVKNAVDLRFANMVDKNRHVDNAVGLRFANMDE